MDKKKHFIFLTEEAKKLLENDPLLKLTYRGSGIGFEVIAFSLNHPFLFLDLKKTQLNIPLVWVKYIASPAEEKSLGFLYEKPVEN